MNQAQLNSFLTLARTLNFTAAARELFTTQPSLSRAIAQMEEELRIKLFHRDKQTVRLTSSGTAFLPYAQHIRDAYDAAYAFAQANAKGIEGEVRIGVATWLFTDILPRLTARMGQAYPNVKLTVQDGSMQGMLGLLESREVDLIFTAGHSLEQATQVQKICLGRIPLRIVVPRDDPLTQEPQPVPLARLEGRGEPFLVVDMSSYAKLKKLFPGADVRHVNSLTRLLVLIEAHMGVAILQAGVRKLSVQNVAFLEIEGDPLGMEAVAAWREDGDNQCLDSFLNELNDMVSDELL